MKIETYETVWFAEHQQFSLTELADLSGMSEAELRQLVDYEVFLPIDLDAAEVRFGAKCLVTARMAKRLRKDLDLDPDSLALTLSLLERIRELEARLQALRAQLPKDHQ